MTKAMENLLAAAAKKQTPPSPDTEVITVSETVAKAASIYENMRNALEYDEEHLLRRNALRRILKRRLGDADAEKLSADLLRELIWAGYLPNKRVPEHTIATVADVLRRYQPLFSGLREAVETSQREYEWLLDLLSTELEYTLVVPELDEALAVFCYQELKNRMVWHSTEVAAADRDLQLYIAVHRVLLKSNTATMRFRVFTIFYPAWTKSNEKDELTLEVAGHLSSVIATIERALAHPASEALYRLIRRHTLVFSALRDLAEDNPSAFATALESGNLAKIDLAMKKAVGERYDRFSARLRRGVVRAILFLFFTKMILAILIELPYEQAVIASENFVPLLVNILFHPLLLAVIGLTVSIPEEKNTQRVLELAHSVLGAGPDFTVTFRTRRRWDRGLLGAIFHLLYAAVLLLVVGIISLILYRLNFNVVSIFFFLFFLSLVTFLGVKIRGTKRELMVVETATGYIATLIDILFLPIARLGRWIAIRAPRINIFLFFFDFIIEAPFKALIGLIEGWLAFLREKKEEI